MNASLDSGFASVRTPAGQDLAGRRFLLFVVNDLAFFISHRLPISMAARDAGWKVHIAAPADDAAERRLAGSGFRVHRIGLRRHGTGPVSELLSVRELYLLFRKLRPDIVHLVTIKPVLYGGIAARLARVPAVVSAISGLGYLFIGSSLRSRILGRLTRPLYRLALGHPRQRVIFQNGSDRKTIEGLGLDLSGNVEMIGGSGVDLGLFTPTPEPEGPVTLLVPSRLLYDKGISEFVEAAKALRAEGSPARFVLVGDAPAGNPSAVPPVILDRWKREGVVEFRGFRADMPAEFGRCHVAVLPSYREGFPKALIEAAACGRPVITTDVPGCRDAIRAGETGILVPVRDAAALADAMRRLIADPELRARMGQAGRELAERNFSADEVARRHLAIYAGLVAQARGV